MLHKVTALTPQKRNHQRINVFLDGEFAFGLERIVAGWLHIGQEISDQKAAELQVEDSREIAFQRALRLISYRPRTEQEVRQRLSRFSTSPEMVDEVIERLKLNHYIDDQKFAEDWIDNRTEFRPRSRKVMAYELKMHGVEQDIIEETLTAVDDEQLAYQAAGRIVRKYPNLEWGDFRLKLNRYLALRGFSYELIRDVTHRVWNELHETDNPPNNEVLQWK